MKSIVLLISIALSGGGSYYPPVTFYDSPESCEVEASKLKNAFEQAPTIKNWKIQCVEPVPEVPEEDVS